MEHFRNLSFNLIEVEVGGVRFKEEWRPLPPEWGLYAVSSFGRLKRLERPYKSKSKNGLIVPEKILLPQKTQRGYLRMKLRRGDRKKTFYIHRLVAILFIENPENKPCINHKTGIKTANHYSQLEWCTPQENNEHAFTTGLSKRGRTIRLYVKKGRAHVIPHHKKVVDIETGNIIGSVKDLSIQTGMPVKKIRNILSGEQCNDTNFRYLGEEGVLKERVVRDIEPSPIAVFDLQGNKIATFRYTKDAAELVKSNVANINKFMKGRRSHVKGFKFKRINEDGCFVDPSEFISKRPPLKPKKVPGIPTPSKTVVKYDISGNEVCRYPSLGDAARSMNTDVSMLRKVVNGRSVGRPGYYKGFFYRYV